MDEQAAREVVAMQFAGGMSIARLAEDWERDRAWVEEAIRLALLETIPKRNGGLKAPRVEMRRAAREEEMEAAREVQQKLKW
jgi:hypothetical protein